MIIYNPSVGKEIGNSKIEATEFSYVSGNSLIKRYVDPPKVVVLGYKVSDDIISFLIACESSGNPLAFNPKDTDGLPAKGILQFKDKTFYRFAELLKIENPDIWNPSQQIKIAEYMLSKGMGYSWGNCWKLINGL